MATRYVLADAVRPTEQVKVRCAVAGKEHQRRSGPPPVVVIPVEEAPRRLLVRLGDALYRGFEIVVALVALLLSLPIMIVEAIIIRLDSPGPSLFWHHRMGQSKPTLGRELMGRADIRSPAGGFQPDKLYWAPTSFRFVKFRTMCHDAAEKYPEYYWWDYDIPREQFLDVYHKIEEDPRLTRFGRWLRKTSFDELPNFWNVLTGEVRLVGPRPKLRQFAGYYDEEQMLEFTVRPGLTCLWAIKGRCELSVRKEIEFDLEYVRNRSLWLDVKILLLTFWAVVARRGAF